MYHNFIHYSSFLTLFSPSIHLSILSMFSSPISPPSLPLPLHRPPSLPLLNLTLPLPLPHPPLLLPSHPFLLLPFSSSPSILILSLCLSLMYPSASLPCIPLPLSHVSLQGGFEITPVIMAYLLNRLGDFSEWG
jgi:hypothetical protein